MQVSTAYTPLAPPSVAGTPDRALSPSAQPQAASSKDSVAVSDQALEASRKLQRHEAVGFALELRYDHASFAAEAAEVQAGPEGLSMSYAGISGEITSTSFSFTLFSAGDSGVDGKGSGNLNGEVSGIAKEVKPMVKAFMAATGENGGWGEINRLMRSVA